VLAAHSRAAAYPKGATDPVPTEPLHRLLAPMLLAGACLTTSAIAAPLAFHVSPSGRDAWSGLVPAPTPAGTDGPFATIERARDAVRGLRAEGRLAAEGAEVIVHAGTYGPLALTSDDSGTPDGRIVFRAAKGDEVRLSGGHTVPADALKPVTDEAVLARLDPAARGHVVWVDLHAEGLGALPEYPSKYRGAPAVPEVFWNDRRLSVSRWPNDGWATIAAIVESGSRPRDGDNAGKAGVFEYDGDRPARWGVDAGVWLQGYWCYDWYDETIRVRAIDPATRRITLAEPHLYGVMAGNPSPRRWRALNVLEELDTPGEYYLDCAGARLYLWPPDDGPGSLSLSLLAEPLVTVTDASHVTVRGFVVEQSLADGIVVTGGTDCRVEACTVRNMRQMGVCVTGGVGHRVEACDIYETGTGGLVLSGGDRKTLTPAGHEALNNSIHAFSRHQLTSAYGLTLGGVGNRAAHNAIYDAPHQAISIAGNDHVFELNVVHDVCLETDDCGALYKGRNPSCRGNLIRHNLWYGIGSPMGHGSAAVYFDDGDGGDTVYGNVFFRCGDPGRGGFGTIFSHGGHDNRATNNILIECKRALGSAPWDDARWRRALEGGEDCFWIEKLRQEVGITQPPYTTHYPELIGFLDPPPGAPRVNIARNNVLVRCGEVCNGNWQCSLDENLVVDHDPGFVDAAAGNLALRPDSEVFARLPGFQPIPFGRIGLYASALRPHPPAVVWDPK
jgi:hypothetical protein